MKGKYCCISRGLNPLFFNIFEEYSVSTPSFSTQMCRNKFKIFIQLPLFLFITSPEIENKDLTNLRTEKYIGLQRRI